MSALAVNLHDIHEPSVEDIESARVAARRLSQLGGKGMVRFRADDDDTQEPICLPANIFQIFIKALAQMGNGNAVAVVPISAELTTQQAADLLNVSRPHLIKLLDQEGLKFRMVGTHRKILAKDVLNFRDRQACSRRTALDELAALDQSLGLYDLKGAAD